MKNQSKIRYRTFRLRYLGELMKKWVEKKGRSREDHRIQKKVSSLDTSPKKAKKPNRISAADAHQLEVMNDLDTDIFLNQALGAKRRAAEQRSMAVTGTMPPETSLRVMDTRVLAQNIREERQHLRGLFAKQKQDLLLKQQLMASLRLGNEGDLESLQELRRLAWLFTRSRGGYSKISKVLQIAESAG